MSLSPNQIFLYAAGPHDYANAQNIASNNLIPFGNVTGDFGMAYAAVKSGKFLVIAVGGAANDALFYNQCGWSNLSAGTSPFENISSSNGFSPPIDYTPGSPYYESAAGTTAQNTYQIAADYVAYALGSSMPYTPIPSVETPSAECAGSNPMYASSAYYTGA